MHVSHDELRTRAAQAAARLRSCDLCPRRCGADRLAGERGFCGLGAEGRWYRELLHHGDEPEISPTHLVDLAGCNLRCAHCSEGGFVCAPEGAGTWRLDPEEMAARVAERRAEGARTLSLAGGEPGVQLPAVLAMLSACSDDTRVVWNGNLWMSGESLASLDGVVDLYLPDFKYGNDDCASRLADADGYTDVLRRNLRALAEQNAPVLVRHLVLPGHLDCCTRPVLTWLRRELPSAVVNLMTVYLPFSRMGRPGVAPPEPLSDAERDEAVALLRALDFVDARVDGQRAGGDASDPSAAGDDAGAT